jgi:hypothetical protein
MAKYSGFPCRNLLNSSQLMLPSRSMSNCSKSFNTCKTSRKAPLFNSRAHSNSIKLMVQAIDLQTKNSDSINEARKREYNTVTGESSGKIFSKLVSTSSRERVPSPFVSQALNAAFIVLAKDVWVDTNASPARNCQNIVLENKTHPTALLITLRELASKRKIHFHTSRKFMEPWPCLSKRWNTCSVIGVLGRSSAARNSSKVT